MSGERSSPAEGTVSFVIGGVGHRVLSSGEQPALKMAIDRALAEELEKNEGIAASVLLLCSVAEGADRLIIQAAAGLGIAYCCVLPCSPNCFEEDFLSEESVLEFRALLESASAVVQPPRKPSCRLDGYLWVNEYIIERASMLLAVWNGGPVNGLAGTAHSIELATSRGCPVLWISSQSPHDAVWISPTVAGQE